MNHNSARSTSTGRGTEERAGVVHKRAGGVRYFRHYGSVAVLALLIILSFSRADAAGSTDTPAATPSPSPSRAAFPECVHFSIEVTGTPADTDTIMDGIRAFFTAHAPGVVVPESLVLPSELRPSESRAIFFDDGPKRYCLTVRNTPVPLIEPYFLALSNHPERIGDRGMLFYAGMLPGKPVVFRYYHEGAPTMTEPLYLSLVLTNASKSPARVFTISSVGRPSTDMMKVGHENNVNYFKKWMARQGRIITVPPASSLEVAVNPIAAAEIISGTAYFSLLEGEPLQFALFARKSRGEQIGYSEILNPKDVHAKGNYPATTLYADIPFAVSQNEFYWTFGDDPLPNTMPGKPLNGNYGNFYRFSLRLVNDSANPATIQILMQPRGGIATGTFLLDDRLVSVGFSKVKEEKLIGEITLKPHETKYCRLVTMPEDASYYPVRIILRVTP